ncbi:SRPBCC family protein [Nitrospira sp. Nam74]
MTHHRPCQFSHVLLGLLFDGVVALVPAESSIAGASESASSLDIIVDEGAAAHVRGHLELASNRETVVSVLTDYEHWPQLFRDGMRMIAIKRSADSVITEMDIPRAVLPGTIRLVIRTRVSGSEQIDAELVRGDLKRFWRRWTLTVLPGGQRTRADLELVLQPQHWAPQWLVRYGLEQDLHDDSASYYCGIPVYVS